MIGYVTIGTNQLEKAAAFFDELLALVGAKRFMETERWVSFGTGPESPSLAVMKPFNGEEATPGNGQMVAIPMQTTAQVDAFHAKALSLGGTDEGAPGPRSFLYCAYFRDLDGNKFNAFCKLEN